jgi:hypothetical protein
MDTGSPTPAPREPSPHLRPSLTAEPSPAPEPSLTAGSSPAPEPVGQPPAVEELRDPIRLLRQLERALDPHRLRVDMSRAVPAWRRVTAGEQRWVVTCAVLAAIVLQLALPARLNLSSPYLLAAVEAALLVVLILLNPGRIHRLSSATRALSLTLIALASAANAYSAGRLALGLIRGAEGEDAAALLATGASIFLTNVLVFGLWYWELDRGGPAARAHAVRDYPDFLFPQMATPDLAADDWEPTFVDYFYVSFTNATAFSPTDTLPLTRWAKMIMMLQSAVSLVTVALVVARAVNILQ